MRVKRESKERENEETQHIPEKNFSTMVFVKKKIIIFFCKILKIKKNMKNENFLNKKQIIKNK